MQNRLPGWQVLLAGLLLTSEGSVPRQPASSGIHQQPTILKNDSTDEHMVGLMEMHVGSVTYSKAVPIPNAGAMTEVDTSRTETAIQGEISVVPSAPTRDSIFLRSADSTLQVEEKPIMYGGIIATPIGNVDSLK